MLIPLVVAAVLLFGSLLVYGAAVQIIVSVVVSLIRSGPTDLGFWKNTAVMASLTGITAAAHLTQIALWAAAFLVCGLVSTWETAFYLSAQSFTALGYGDVPMSEGWRLLGPLEAVNGLLFFGVSTAVLFTVMSQLIAHRLRAEAGNPGAVAGNPAPLSMAGDAGSE
ncbi:MAG: potassium channel family protein [Isosphaeraceae bacterium]